MATRLASNQPAPMALGQHTSGIYADMTVDGPEIGTLVIIVDRAKNLPNRKAMGKQNPYCAARLGKEAKKTETDKRGGQTPRWDQELRFVVHDSLDYHNLKLSVFSEDKKTDLVGEAWINLDKVLQAGGGKCDLWQTLNCKGKYSGEIRIELTYYDSRPRPEKKVAIQEDAALKQSASDRVKRRPLPAGPGSSAPSSSRTPLTPSTIPGPTIPGRARHGPRDLQAPIRANSLPPVDSQHQFQQHPSQTSYQHDSYGSHPAMLPHMHSEPTLPVQIHPEYEENYSDLRTHSEPNIQPDFLPTLPPPNRQQGILPAHDASYADVHAPHQLQLRPTMSQPHPHAHSDPGIPQQHDFSQDMGVPQQMTIYTGAPEPLPDLDYQHNYVQQRHRRSDVSQTSWSHQEHLPIMQEPLQQQHHYAHQLPPLHSQQRSLHQPQQHQQLQHTDYHQHSSQPPLPPMHSRTMSAQPLTSVSAPTTPREHVPQDTRMSYSGRPVSRGQQQYISNISPLQSIEQGRFDDYEPPSSGYQPLPRDGPDPDFSPSPMQSHSRQSPYTTPPHRRAPTQNPDSSLHRHSVATPYAAHGLRQSPHPLSQEVPRARSPLPDLHDRPFSMAPHSAQTEGDRNQAELNRTAITPVVRPRAISPSRQTVSDGPKRSEWKPKNTYSIQSPIRAFESSDDSPLSHTRHPRSSNGIPRKSVSPHPSPANVRTPSSVPYGPDSFDVHNPAAATQIRDETPSGPITGWDGREIDPSDHLPVASWAPEPEVKTPSKTYGLGRDRDFGPRSAEAANSRFSRDTLVNVHRKGAASADNTPSNTIRARLVKKSHHTAVNSHDNGSPIQSSPLREHPNYNPVPDPYQQTDHSRGYSGSAPAQHKPRHSTGGHAAYGYGHGPPDLPPKVPLDVGYGSDAYGPDALSREIASIDIGAGSRGGRVPAPMAYVPARSHRERDGFFY